MIVTPLSDAAYRTSLLELSTRPPSQMLRQLQLLPYGQVIRVKQREHLLRFKPCRSRAVGQLAIDNAVTDNPALPAVSKT